MLDYGSVATDMLVLWHGEALQALHALSTGRREASMSVGTNGASRAVSYTQANIGDLKAYLAALQAELGRRGIGAGPRRRAIGVRF